MHRHLAGLKWLLIVVVLFLALSVRDDGSPFPTMDVQSEGEFILLEPFAAY